jgi:CHAT domain-containing protein
VPDSVLQQEETVKNEVAVLEQTLLDAQQKLSDDTIQILENSLTDAKKRHLDFLARLEQKYPDYFSLIYDTQVAGIDDIQQKLLEDNILLEYALTDEAVFLFVISPDNAHFLRFNKENQLNDRIVSLRSALLQKDYQRYVETAHSLYQQLMQQAEGEMAAVKKMIVVPDGMLALLPFEILLTDTVANISEDYSALPYLLHKHQICYNYSATVALATKAKKSNAARIEVLGFAPDFTSSGGQDFIIASTAYEDTIRGALVPLEGAEAELSSLSGLFDGSYFFRQEATEENFKRMAAHSRIIHLATHAVADDNDPMYSRLYFTKADTLQEDGILHTYELYNLKLNAALVTLSACNTGLGKIQQGEGIVSLASGFAYAGCPNIVMSLWPASDKATARLMEIFYQGLSEGLPKDEALYQAKLQYLSSADQLSANPYFWGSFVFVGDPIPLKATMSVRMVVAIMAGIILVISGLVYFVRNRR